MLRAKYKIKQGFTLVEVVVAAALLVLALSAFIASFVQSRRSVAIADNRLDAIHTARERMETLLSYAYNNPALSDGTHPPLSSPFSNGFYTVNITNAPAAVKDITVTVWWVNPGSSITSTVSLAGSMSSELHQ